MSNRLSVSEGYLPESVLSTERHIKFLTRHKGKAMKRAQKWEEERKHRFRVKPCVLFEAGLFLEKGEYSEREVR